MSYAQIKTLLAEGDFDGAQALIEGMKDEPFTVAELESAIQDAASGWYGLRNFYDHPSSYTLNLRGERVTPVMVDLDEGARFGTADQAISVFRVDDRYFRMTGWVSSYSDTDWDGQLTEVEPETKTVTVYKEVSR